MTSQVRYTEEIAEHICDQLASGLSMRKICREPGMPDRRTVERWMESNPDFAAKCARAREIGFDENADQMREEIDAEEDVSKARLIFDYGKWRLSKLAPKKYGDRATIEGPGPNGEHLHADMSASVLAALRAKHGPDAG
jgi:hypothetical protein